MCSSDLTMQAVIAGSVDIGVAAGTLGVMGAYAKGAPVRIIGAESTGEDSYWYVRADSPVKSMADMKGRSMAYSTNGSSTHANALAFVELYKVDAKLIATGGFPATFTMVMSGQIDAGWSAPPYAMEALRKGEIRVIARSSELPLVKGHTIRVLIANKQSLDSKPDVYRRFMRAYRETVDWMYASDEAVKIYAEFAKIDAALARLDDGTYGYCEETGEPIALKRLEARPIATLSVEAQERHERRERIYRDE